MKDIYISFAKTSSTLYPPIKYLSSENLTDIISYVDRSGRKLAALSSDGKVFVISSFFSPDNSCSIAIGQGVSVIQEFDYNNDTYKDLCFIDKANTSFNILLSERRNLFRSYFSTKILDSYNSILVDDSKPLLKTFFFFTKGKKAIEIVKIDFDQDKITRHVLYTDGIIEDLQVAKDRLKDKNSIFILTKNGLKLLIEQFDLFKNEYVKKTTHELTSNVIAASLELGVYKNTLALIKQDKSIDLIDLMFDKWILKTNPRLTFELDFNDKLKFQLLYIDRPFAKSRPAISLLSVNNKNSFYFFAQNKNYRYSTINDFSEKHLIQYEINSESSISFFFYNDLRKKIVELNFNWNDKKFYEKDIFESQGINNYLVTKFDKQNLFVFYINSTNGYINIKRI